MIKNLDLKKLSLVEILFYILPITFVLGNLILSINFLLCIIFGLIVIRKEQLIWRFKQSYWILIVFFLYLFLLTTIQFSDYAVWTEIAVKSFFENPEAISPPVSHVDQLNLENHPIFKSLLLSRFVILVIVTDILFYNEKLKLKKFFLVSLICTSFVSLDIIFQYIFGFDLFGLKSSGRWHSGPFGDELIAGSFLQKFSLLSFFYIFYINKSKNLNNPLIIFLIFSHALAIALSGNRMPFLLFLFASLLIILLIKNFRFVMSSGLIIFLVVFIGVSKHNPKIGAAYQSFFEQSNVFNILKYKKNSKEKNINEVQKDKKVEKHSFGPNKVTADFLRTTGHGRIYLTAIEMWKEKPILGHGLKSFRFKCWEIMLRIDGLACSNHPHNYYLELLSEVGIIGFLLMLAFFAILIKKSFNYFRKNNFANSEKYLLISLFLVFFLEIWPLRSSGSFFTTWGSTLFWLIVSLLCANLEKKPDNSIR